MAPKTLHEGWSALTGIGAALGSTTPVAAPAPGVSAEALLPAPSPSQSTRSNDVPLLIQDPFNVLLSHFLLLPFNVDTAYFLTIVKACYNLTLTQVLARMTSNRMSKKQRERLQSTAKPTNSSSQSNNSCGSNFAGYLCQIINYVESTTFYCDESEGGDVPMTGEDDDVEGEAQEEMLPFLRIASLIRHYVFNVTLPEI